MRALISGQVDSFDSATGGVVATARGADVKFVGCSWLAVPYVVLARAGITRMDGLKGKTIAASAPGTPPDIVARASLAAAKVPDQDIKFAAIGGDRDRYNALLGGIVDAAVVANEYTPMPSSKSLNLLVEARQVLPQWVRFCTLMNSQALGLRREAAVRFLSAQIKAFRYAVAHRAETIKLTQEATDAAPDDPRPAYVFDEAVKPGVVAADFPLPTASLDWMRDKLVELGQIPKADMAQGDRCRAAGAGPGTHRQMTGAAIQLPALTVAPARRGPQELPMGEVDLVNVSKQFMLRIDGKVHTVKALDRVSFAVRDGEIVALIGPSGCGKTTALRIAMGLETASGGKVTVDGREVKGCGHDRGMVFQFAELLPWLTAMQNVMFGLEMKGMRGAQLRATAARYLELVGLSDSLNRRPHQLSGGMKQRVGIARALAIDPKVLLMDEPFGALDAQTRETMQAELLDIHARTGKTILFVTHDLDEAVLIADRIVVLKDGRVQEIMTVPLPRPRPDLGVVRGLPEFAATRYRVWQALHQPGDTLH